MTELTLSQQLAQFCADSSFDRLPDQVVQSVKLRVLDSLGIQIAASAFGLGDGVERLVGGWGGSPEASVVGSEVKAPAPQAALVNGTLAHSLDFDDTHLPSILHPSASIVPACLAMAESTRASGARAIAAIAVGIELTVRIGMAGYLPDQGNVFFNKGWHATSICGTLGAAAAGAVLLGLRGEGVMHALGIAASMGAGVIEANRSGGTVKRLHCGWAANAGLTAALLVKEGFTGPPSVLEGRFGFYRAYLGDQYDAMSIVAELGQRWELPNIFFKPYPANHYTHAGIDAALAIRRQIGRTIGPDDVDRIDLGAAEAALRTIGEPRAEKIIPRSGYHAQFSGPFTVATALLGGGGLGVYFDDFTDERARDPRVLALAARVHTFVDPACDALFPRQFPAVLRVSLRDGSVYEHRVMYNRGGPANPLSEDELLQKFALNAGYALTERQASDMATAISELDAATDVGALLAMTRPAT
ncbi:MAG: MmgE/PrpD family protein [Chloroflexota bacterium]